MKNQEQEVRYLWSIDLPLRLINESGIRLKTDIWAIFFVMKEAIKSEWSDKEHFEGNQYAWVSNKYIKSQLRALADVADISDNALYRKIKQLEEVGLLIRMKGNDKKGRCYMKCGPIVDFFKFPEPYEKTQGVGDAPIEKMQGDPLQNCNTPIAKTQGYNSIEDNKDKSITSETPDSQANGVAVAPKKRRVKSKLRITTDEAILHYETELKNLAPIPQDSLAAAAAPREKKLAYGYKLLYEWMRDGDAEIPNGMKDTVMHMGEQLTFNQLCILADGEKRLTMFQIKHYLTRMHTFTENKNLSIYLTICKWFNDDVKLGKVPPKQPVANGQQQQPKTGMSIPKEVTQ